LRPTVAENSLALHTGQSKVGPAQDRIKIQISLFAVGAENVLDCQFGVVGQPSQFDFIDLVNVPHGRDTLPPGQQTIARPQRGRLDASAPRIDEFGAKPFTTEKLPEREYDESSAQTPEISQQP